MLDEIWKDIEGYEGLYQVSNKGRIRNKKHKILKTWNKQGKKKYYNSENDYQKIHLSKNNILKTYQVHRLVANAFIPNYKKLPQINHKNGKKNDNRVENLEWCTCKENVRHYFTNLKKGKKNGNSK